jgi:nitrite reductase/ring-hydroxylating ferredoxin subunit
VAPADPETAGEQRSRHYAGEAGSLREGERWLLEAGGRPIGVFLVRGAFLAYESSCPHSGGPVCEGQIRPAVAAVVDEQGRLLAERSEPALPRLACPWHGWEFDLETGTAVGDPLKRLHRIDVEVEDGRVYVVA